MGSDNENRQDMSQYNQPGGGQQKEDPKPEGASPKEYKDIPGNQT